ncbi:MAG: hypothetical protein HY810_02450 [Candidatus Omnitrophica bacterium]|nr:hypothetical protein [Candidatus Omnitrophota bacterium]
MSKNVNGYDYNLKFRKFKGLVFSFGLSFAFIVSVSAFFLIGDISKEKIVNIEGEFPVRGNSFSREFNLPENSDYIVNIKYASGNTEMERVTLNGKILEGRISNISKSLISSRYFYAPKNIILPKNKLEIKFFPCGPQTIDLRFRNYLTFFAEGNAVAALRENPFRFNEKYALMFNVILFFAAVLFMWYFIFNFEVKFLGISLQYAIINNLLSFIFPVFLCVVLGLVSKLSPYLVIMNNGYLLLAFMVFVGVINLLVNIICVYFEGAVLKVETLEFAVIRKSLFWFKKLLFTDKIVIIFMAVIIAGAIILCLGLTKIAEIAANTAYFLILSAVLLRLVGSVAWKE